MNQRINIFFRIVPLAMAAFCFAYGAYIYATGDDPSRLTTGPIVFFLGAICTALHGFAATVARQIDGSCIETAKYLFPAIGYSFALATLVCGVFILTSHTPGSLIAGHVVCGWGLITAGISTVTTSSSRFSLIPGNSADASFSINPQGFTIGQAATLLGIASATALIAWAWCILLFAKGTLPAHTVAGSVLFGVACICTSLVALTASIARQIRGSYAMREKSRWKSSGIALGALAFVLGIVLFVVLRGQATNFAGFVLFGLALVCWSIASATALLARIWHAASPAARPVPVLPATAALVCLFMAAFLFEATDIAHKYYLPARVLTGFGAICFSLYAIVPLLGCSASRK